MSQEIINVKELPNLHQLEASPRELSSEYWTPETEGEYKVGVVVEIKSEIYKNDAGVEVDLPCILFLSQEENGTFNTIRNGSKRLVATIEKAIENGIIQYGNTPVRITYVGKEKNKTNSYKSDKWSVKPLIV